MFGQDGWYWAGSYMPFMDLNVVSVHEKATKKDFFGSLPKL